MRDFSIANYFDMLSQSQKIYSRDMEPICKKWDLTRNELDVALFLFNNPSYDRAADIVSRRGIAKSHVSMSVAGLEEKGLLERVFSQEDRRIAHLKLTEQGRCIAAEARQAQKHFFNKLYEGITDEEMVLFRRISQKVYHNMEKINER